MFFLTIFTLINSTSEPENYWFQLLQRNFCQQEEGGQLCTLTMVVDQKLFHVVEKLLQAITKTQENLGEMLNLQKQQNEMNHKALQNSIHLQKEVKDILKDTSSGQNSGSMKRNSSDQSTKKFPRLEGSNKIEHDKKKKPLKHW